MPRGESLQARNLPLHLGKGDLNLSALTHYQQEAAQGFYAQAMAGYLQWLARQYDDNFSARVSQEHAHLREKARREGLHPRVPGVVANLALGWKFFLAFALEVEAITAAQRDDLAQQVWKDLFKAAATQTSEIAARDCARRFLELVVGAINSGKAYLTSKDAGEPANPGSCGWYVQELQETKDETYERWRAQGHPIGWIDGDDVFLDPEGSYAVAQRLAEEQGERLPVTQAQLHRRLKEQRLLASSERDRATVRRMYQGQPRSVLYLRMSTLISQKPVVPVDPVEDPQNTGEDAPVSTAGFDDMAGKPVGETGGNTLGNGGVTTGTTGTTGFWEGGGTPGGENTGVIPGTTGTTGFQEGGGAAGGDSDSGEVQEGEL